MLCIFSPFIPFGLVSHETPVARTRSARNHCPSCSARVSMHTLPFALGHGMTTRPPAHDPHATSGSPLPWTFARLTTHVAARVAGANVGRCSTCITRQLLRAERHPARVHPPLATLPATAAPTQAPCGSCPPRPQMWRCAGRSLPAPALRDGGERHRSATTTRRSPPCCSQLCTLWHCTHSPSQAPSHCKQGAVCSSHTASTL
jgi:hypothetical protein